MPVSVYFFALIAYAYLESVQSDSIIFGQSIALSGEAEMYGKQMYSGIKAAFEEQNDKGGVRGYRLELTAKDDEYTPSRALENTKEFVSNDTIFGLIGNFGTPTSLVSFPVAVEAKYPFIGALTGVIQLRNPFSPYIINFRSSYIDETAVMVEFLVKQDINRISILMQNDSFGLSGKEGVMMGITSKEVYLFSEGIYTPYTENVDQALYDIEYNSIEKSLTPQAIIMIGDYKALSKFVILAKAKWPNIFYMTLSVVGAEVFYQALKIKAEIAGLDDWNKNVIVTQCVPLPTDTSHEVVEKYQAALKKYDSQINPSSISLEGYLVGRLTIKTLFRIPGPFKRDAFVNAVYQSGFYNLDGIRCGPYLADGRNFFGETSGCNQCMRKVWAIEADKDLVLHNKPEAQFSFQTCGYRIQEKNYFKFAATGNFLDPLSKYIVMGIFSAFHESNRAGGIHGTMLSLNLKNNFGNSTTITKFIDAVSDDPQILGLVGLSDDHSIDYAINTAKQIPIIGIPTGLEKLRNPFDRRVVNLRISFQDEGAVMASLLTSKGFTGVSIIRLDNEACENGIKGIELGLLSVRSSIRSQEILPTSSNETEMIANIHSVLNKIESKSSNGKKLEGIILLTSQNIPASINLLIETKKRWPSVSVVLSNSYHYKVDFGVEIVKAAEASSLSIKDVIANVYFTQVVPSPNDDTSTIIKRYQRALHFFDPTAKPDFVSLEGYLVGRFIIEAIGRTSGAFNRKNFLDSIYSSGEFKIEEVTFGPFANGDQYQCNKGLDMAWISKLEENGSFTIQDKDIYSIPWGQCGFIATKQYDFQTDGLRLGFLAITIVVQIFLFVIKLLYIIYRNHETIKPGFYFSFLTLLGLNFTLLINIVLYQIPNQFSCQLQPAIIHGSLVFTYVPLCVRIHQIYKYFKNPDLKNKNISDREIAKVVVPIYFYFAGLILWRYISYLPIFTVDFFADGTRYELCAPSKNLPSYIVLVSEFLMLILGCVDSIRINDVQGDFKHLDESKSIGICIYQTTTFTIIIAAFHYVLKVEPNLYFAAYIVTINLNAIVAAYLLYIKKLLKVRKPTPVLQHSLSIVKGQPSSPSRCTGERN